MTSVGAESDSSSPLAAVQHRQRRLALGNAGGVGERGIDDQAVAVFHQQVTHEAQPARLPVALAVEPGVGVMQAGGWSSPSMVLRYTSEVDVAQVDGGSATCPRGSERD